MTKHSHSFVEEYDGLVGFGFNREVDEATLTYFLQKFSDDRFIALARSRMSHKDMEELFNLLSRMTRQYVSEEEYHRYFLKDMDDE